jgi:DNA-binding NarL/FixJ family response regulator
MARGQTDVGNSAAKILIVDDHPTVREGLALRISQQSDLEVSGEAADIAGALQLLSASHHDVAVIDVSLATGNGIDLIKRIRDRDHPVRILVWSMYSDSLYAERALRAGAMGYINKEQATEKIIDAIRCVLQGKVYLSKSMADRFLHSVVGRAGGGMDRPAIEDLSDRELETFRFIAMGLETRQVAEKMHVSPKTVETYRARIKEKMGIRTGVELVREAMKWT